VTAGRGRIEVARVAGRSAVVGLAARSPLKLLNPRNHGSAAWAVATSFGGGLVDGDELALEVTVGPGAAACLATQASTKIYPGSSAQSLAADVGEGALFVAVPDPVVPFAGGRYRQRSTVRLAEGASLVWLESVTAGRAPRGERWAAARYESHTRVERGGALLVADGLVLDPAHGPLGARMGRFDALATLIVAGGATAEARAHVLSAAAPRGAVLVAPSPISGDAVVARIAVENAEALARTLRSLLAPVVALLGDDPLGRRLPTPTSGATPAREALSPASPRR